MFEEGTKLKARFGEENVFDFSLGNPDIEPPREFKEALIQLANHPVKGMHRYMPNPGYPEVRSLIAEDFNRMTGLFFNAENVIMTVGAGGGLNVLLKALLDEDDEVVIFAPYFVEYIFYINNHGGKCVIAETNREFKFDFNELEKAVTKKTKAVIINSPNNPTGAVYGADDLDALADFLGNAEKKFGHPIYLVSDEPYRKIIFDGLKHESIMNHYDNSIVIYSHSKDLGLAGERIGYVAISPNAADVKDVSAACAFTVRTLGFVNAPALMQRLCGPLQQVSVDARIYERKRDFLYNELTGMGFKCIKPQGTFYLFPECPLDDDIDFVNLCVEEQVLVVPGSGFGRAGYFRLGYCIPDEVIRNSIPRFRTIAGKIGLK